MLLCPTSFYFYDIECFVAVFVFVIDSQGGIFWNTVVRIQTFTLLVGPTVIPSNWSLVGWYHNYCNPPANKVLRGYIEITRPYIKIKTVNNSRELIISDEWGYPLWFYSLVLLTNLRIQYLFSFLWKNVFYNKTITKKNHFLKLLIFYKKMRKYKHSRLKLRHQLISWFTVAFSP